MLLSKLNSGTVTVPAFWKVTSIDAGAFSSVKSPVILKKKYSLHPGLVTSAAIVLLPAQKLWVLAKMPSHPS